MAEFATNDSASETTKCVQFFVIQRTNLPMPFSEALEESRDQQCIKAVEIQLTMEDVHKHLQVEMRRSQVIQKENANHSGILAPNIQEESHHWLDAHHGQTIRPTWN